MAVPSYLAKGTASFNATTAHVAATLPASIQANDIIIGVFGIDVVSVPAFPAGWTAMSHIHLGPGTQWGSLMAWKRMTGGESGTVQVTLSNANIKIEQLYHFRGCISTGTPFEDYNPVITTASTATSGTTTTTGADRLGVRISVISDDQVGSTPSGWSTAFAADTTTTGNDIGIVCDTKTIPSATTEAATSRTLAASHPHTIYSFALIPEPPGEAVSGDTTVTITTPGAGTWPVPTGVTEIDVEGWGAGGGGYGGGGSGGAYARTLNLTVTPGGTVYYNNGAGGIGGTSQPTDTWVNISANSAPASVANGILAKGGQNAHITNFTGEAGGQASASIGTVKFSGGAGGNTDAAFLGGGGGGAAGDAEDGTSPFDAGSYHISGPGGDVGGGDGGRGADSSGTYIPPDNGQVPGGGGGGSWTASDANGAAGTIKIWYNAPGGTSYSTSVTPASFTVTGATVNPIFARVITVTPASFVFTGSNVTPVYSPGGGGINYSTPVTPAAFTFTGSVVAPRLARTIPISPASFIVTGLTRNPIYARFASITPASFIFTGSTVNPVYTPGAVAGKVSVKHAGIWKAATPYAKHAGTWKPVTAIYVKQGGTWVQTS